MSDPTYNPEALDNCRGILRGHVCICGQTWPDFVRTENALQVRTECCGAIYQYAEGGAAVLSLIEPGPGLS